MSRFNQLAIFLILVFVCACGRIGVTSTDTPPSSLTTPMPTLPQPSIITEQIESGAYFIRTGELWDSHATGSFGKLAQVGKCLRLDHGNDIESTLLIWQTNTQVSTFDNQFEIVGVHGLYPIRLGTALALNGTYFQLPDEWQEFIPDECDGPYFMVVSGISSSNSDTTERGYAIGPDPNLVDVEWQLVELNGERLPDDFVPTILFTSDGAEGYTGCNRWSSIGKMITNGFIFLPFVASETSDCAVPDLAKNFVDMLTSKANSYYLRDSQLVMSDKDGEIVLVFDSK